MYIIVSLRIPVANLNQIFWYIYAVLTTFLILLF